MKRVLVTGASGFVGRHAIRPLQDAGYEIVALSRHPRSAPAIDGLRWVECDLLSEHCFDRVVEDAEAGTMLHCAWETEHGAFWESPANLDWLQASKKLIEAFVRAGGHRVVGVGTCAEYDWSTLHNNDATCQEKSTQIRPHTLYGRSKNALHDWLRQLMDSVNGAAVWARLFMMYGDGEDRRRLVPFIVARLLSGMQVETGPSHLRRDYLNTRDIGRALALVVASDHRGVINMGSGDPITIGQLAETIAEVIGAPNLLKLDALPARPNEPTALVADVTTLRSVIGFTPSIGLEEGLTEIVERSRFRRAQ